MSKKEHKVFSVILSQHSVDILRKEALKFSKGAATRITVADCIRYALVNTYPTIKEHVPTIISIQKGS